MLTIYSHLALVSTLHADTQRDSYNYQQELMPTQTLFFQAVLSYGTLYQMMCNCYRPQSFQTRNNRTVILILNFCNVITLCIYAPPGGLHSNKKLINKLTRGIQSRARSRGTQLSDP